jgi:hypothetical protein
VNLEHCMKPLVALYGSLPASEFGPLKLKAVRQKMIEADLCRGEINKRMGRIKRILRWATENELLPATVFHALQSVRGLVRGRCDKAKVPRWHPHQLRHNAATWLRKEFGLDIARVVLGHRSPQITEHYAEIDFGKTQEIMGRVG